MTKDAPADVSARGMRLLLADDDAGVRAIFATLLRSAAGVDSVVEAADGIEALALAREYRLDVVVLDLNMTRLDGIEAALRLRSLQPTLPIALHSSDPEPLRQRVTSLELPLFDKTDFGRLLSWVEQQARAAVVDAEEVVTASAGKLDLSATVAAMASSAASPPLDARCAAGTRSGPNLRAGAHAAPLSMSASVEHA